MRCWVGLQNEEDHVMLEQGAAVLQHEALAMHVMGKGSAGTKHCGWRLRDLEKMQMTTGTLEQLWIKIEEDIKEEI